MTKYDLPQYGLERSRSDEEVRQSEHRLAKAASIAHVGCWEYDFETDKGIASDEGYRILGLPPNTTLTFAEFQQIIHPEDRSNIAEAWAKVIQDSHRIDSEHRIIRPDGEVRFLHAVAVDDIIKDQSGRPLRIFGVWQDITEQKRTQEELALFRSLIDHSNDAIEVIDPETGRFLDVNQKACLARGYTREEYLAKGVRDLDPTMSDQAVWEQHVEYLRTNGFRIFEGQHRRKDGSVFPVEINVTYIRLKRDYLLAVVRDITERKLAEESLRQSEQQYHTLLNETQTGFIITEPDGNLLQCNPAALQIFGFRSDDEAKQTKTGSLFKNSKDRETLITKLQIEKKIVNYPVEMAHRSGSTLNIVGNVIGEFDKQGELTRIIGFFYDDTERRRLEQQFIQAQKMDSLGTLTGGIAHDFNNILGIILGHATLIGRLLPDPKKLAQSVEAIEKAASRGASLVKQLLTFARKSDVILKPLSVNDQINDLVKLLFETFPKQIDVVTDLDPKVPPLTADQTQLYQVLLNLCVNARDAMPQGGRLKITTTLVSGDSLRYLYPQAGAREYVNIDVADTGAGMDEETRKRIFEPFFSTKGFGKGTGLGLSTVFGIVQNHSGFIDVKSTVGKGTTFQIFFPVQTNTHKEIDINGQISEVIGGNETILIVEDEESLRDTTKNLLELSGYTVMCAENGRDGLELFKAKSNSIDLIITDLGMPSLTGELMIEEIWKINQHTKVIVTSGYFNFGKKSQLLSSGVKEVIQKPYTAELILHKVRNVLDLKNLTVT